MNKLSKNESGFTAVEGLLIILILAVIGGVGYMVYHNGHKTKTVSATSATTTSTVTKKATTPTSTIPNFPSTYNGWNSYCISSVGLCMKYPQGYNLENCTDGPSPSDCDVETKDVRNGSDSFPTVGWDISLASSAQNPSCGPYGINYSVGSKLTYISNLYIAKSTITNETGFNGEVTYYLLEGNGNNSPSTANCPTSFPSKDGKYNISISARDGSPATPTLSDSQIAAYDQTITQILNSFYYQ
jgi:hypothetical protein